MEKRKPNRKPNGAGSIYQEPSGRFRISISIWQDGQRKRITRTAWRKSDANVILDELRNEAKGGGFLTPNVLTVGNYLNVWLSDVVSVQLSANTHESYRIAVEKHISPRIGALKLKDLGPLHVQNMLSAMVREGVGSRTRQNVYIVLKTALAKAVDLTLITSNPCRAIKRPKHEAKGMAPLTLEEAKAIISETAGTRWHALFVLALTTGMRQGELLGLRWDRVDLDGAKLRIDQQAIDISGRRSIGKPKTKSSVRVVQLTPQAVAALQSHRAILLRDGLASSELVFPAPEGGIENRGNFRTRIWQPLLRRLAIESRGFHNTRHTYATLGIGANIPIPVISQQLGHASVSTTLNIYAHVLETHQSAAVETISKMFG